MAPRGSSNASNPKAETLQSEVVGVDASQDADNQYFSDLLRQRQKRTAERRTQRKLDILARHKERTEELKKSIAERVEKYRLKVKSLRRPRIQRLTDLTHKRKELEAKVEASRAELQQAFLSASNGLRLALNSRLDSLST